MTRRPKAQKERDEFQRKNEEFDRSARRSSSKATEEANAERQRLIDDARQEPIQLQRQATEALQKRRSNLNQAIRRRTQQEVFAVARKTLADLAGASLEERMIEVFISRAAHDATVKAKAERLGAGASRTPSEPAARRSCVCPRPQRLARGNTKCAQIETFCCLNDPRSALRHRPSLSAESNSRWRGKRSRGASQTTCSPWKCRCARSSRNRQRQPHGSPSRTVCSLLSIARLPAIAQGAGGIRRRT